jgi:hypothetical protein
VTLLADHAKRSSTNVAPHHIQESSKFVAQRRENDLMASLKVRMER